jgi:hypothetical protein
MDAEHPKKQKTPKQIPHNQGKYFSLSFTIGNIRNISDL